MLRFKFRTTSLASPRENRTDSRVLRIVRPPITAHQKAPCANPKYTISHRFAFFPRLNFEIPRVEARIPKGEEDVGIFWKLKIAQIIGEFFFMKNDWIIHNCVHNIRELFKKFEFNTN